MVVENEFGVINVDSAILRQGNTNVLELSGGCICCGLKANFRELVAELAKGDVRIIVEPSGIFNPHDFFDVVFEPAIRERCALGSVIAIADPFALEEVEGQSLDILREQVNCSGLAVLSKTGGMPPARSEEVVARLAALFDEPAEGRIESRPWDGFTDADFQRFSQVESDRSYREKRFWDHGALFGSVIVHGKAPIAEGELIARLERLLGGDGYGEVLRVKGYHRAEGGGFFEVNCTRNDMSVLRLDMKARSFLTIIGSSLDRRRIEALFSA